MPIDMVESEQEYQLTTELPGLKPEDVDISISGNTLTIKGEFPEEKESEGKNVHYRERTASAVLENSSVPPRCPHGGC